MIIMDSSHIALFSALTNPMRLNTYMQVALNSALEVVDFVTGKALGPDVGADSVVRKFDYCCYCHCYRCNNGDNKQTGQHQLTDCFSSGDGASP